MTLKTPQNSERELSLGDYGAIGTAKSYTLSVAISSGETVMNGTPEFGDDELNNMEHRAKTVAVRVALKIINDFVDSLEAVKIESSDESFAKGAAKGIQIAVQLAEDYGSMLRQMK